MTTRHIVASFGLIFGMAVHSMACSSARTVCDLICECEHCSNETEGLVCLEYEAKEKVSEAYECNEEWEAYLDCVQEKGVCNENRARFYTGKSTKCGPPLEDGLSCDSDSRCQTFIGATSTCSDGRCVVRTCAESGFTCSSDADCVGIGEAQCATAEQAAFKCVEAASGGAGPDL